MMQTTLGRA